MLSPQSLRSSSSSESSLVTIFNATKREIEMVWLDYEGKEVTYGVLQSKRTFKVRTFVSHPWIFYLSGSRFRLNVCLPNHRPTDVLWPQKLPDSSDARPQINYAIVIFPVLSLRDSCFQALRDSAVTDEILNQLCIPDSIKREFKQFRSS